eukprot:6662974-Lingulodinium_polyedra.AAC.1
MSVSVNAASWPAMAMTMVMVMRTTRRRRTAMTMLFFFSSTTAQNLVHELPSSVARHGARVQAVAHLPHHLIVLHVLLLRQAEHEAIVAIENVGLATPGFAWRCTVDQAVRGR